MKRITSEKTWEEVVMNLVQEAGYGAIWRRLNQIEDILGDTYELDRLRELMEADEAGLCVIAPPQIVYELHFVGGDYCNMYCMHVDGQTHCGDCKMADCFVLAREWKGEKPEEFGEKLFLSEKEADAAKMKWYRSFEE